MIRLVVSLAVTFLVGALIWFGLGVVAPDMYVEKALVYIVYPALGAGVITALMWRRHKRSR